MSWLTFPCTTTLSWLIYCRLMWWWQVVILGGSDYACFCAKGLAALGAHVHIVSTGTPNVPNHVHRMTPATDDVGFAAVVATFDVLLDTLSDETKLGETSLLDNDALMTRSGSGVVALLQKRHKCTRYVPQYTCKVMHWYIKPNQPTIQTYHTKQTKQQSDTPFSVQIRPHCLVQFVVRRSWWIYSCCQDKACQIVVGWFGKIGRASCRERVFRRV